MVQISLEAPGKNALSRALIDKTLAQVEAGKGEPLLLTGAGDAFCAGLNLKEIASFDARALRSYLEAFDRLVAALYGYPGPTAAALNGHAIAGGCVLALCCDERICTSGKARIGLNEVSLGARFPPVTMAMIRERLSPQHLDAVVLGAALFDGAEALRLGLVHALSADPVASARAALEHLAANAPHAYAAAKRDLRARTLQLVPTHGDWDDIVAVWTSAETRRRMQAVLAR